MRVNNDRQTLINDPSSSDIILTPGFSGRQADGMLRHMLTAWHISPTRRHQRQERYDWLTTCHGLSAVHHYLKGQLTQPSDFSHTAQSGEPESYEISSRTPLISRNGEHHYSRYRWRQINSCTSGVCIELPATEQQHFRIGDLVLFEKESEQASRWYLGIIKRMLVHLRGGRMEVGIQLIPGIVQSAMLIPQSVAISKDVTPQPVIHLHRGPEVHDTVFTQPSIYKPYTEFLLEPDIGKNREVSAGRLLETANSYDWFEIPPLNS